MALRSKPTPVRAISVPAEYPRDFPKQDSLLDKWWYDTRTVLLRQATVVQDLANAISNLQASDASALGARISTLELQMLELQASQRGLIVDADVAQDAAIKESKLALDFPTHDGSNDPTANEKAALVGTSGTPSAGNRYVTNGDPRLLSRAIPNIGVMIVRDEQPDGTGEDSVTDTWVTRVLNTVVYNDITGASLASNQVSLPKGTYLIEGRASALGLHRVRLADVTGTPAYVYGSSQDSGIAFTPSFAETVLEFSAAAVLELQHRTNYLADTSGFGSPVSQGENEVYAQLLIMRLA